MAFMRDANNLNWAFTATYHGSASTGVVNEATDLNHGEVAVLNENNTILTGALAAGDQFKIAQRVGSTASTAELILSPLLTFKSGAASNYTAAAQQITTIGSNGTTTVGIGGFGVGGDTAAVAAVGDSYYMLIEKQDNDEASRSGYAPAITAQVKLTNPNSYTEAEYIHVHLAEQLREAVRVNDQLEASTPSTKGPKYLRAEVLVVDGTTKTTTGKNCVCVHGSKTISSHDGGNFAAMAAGSYLVLGEDVYKTATGGGGATITLEQPFAGASQTVTAGTSTAQVGFLTYAELSNLTGVGLRLTATDQHTFDVDRHRMYSQSRFNVRFAKDGADVGAAITVGTQANDGNGDFRQVLSDFYNSMGNSGQRWVSDTPAVSRTVPTDGSGHDAFTSSSLGFGTIAVAVEADNKTLLSSGTAKQLVRLYLAFDDNTTDGISGTAQTILETVFGAAGVITDAAA
jgi:hypothetical protein